MPVVSIKQPDSISTEQKAEVTKRITDAMVEVYGTKPSSVMVFFEEYNAEAWGKDGVLAKDRK